MTEIFLVMAFGGRYEEAWERVIRAFYTEADAQALIDFFEIKLAEIRSTKLPESLELWNFDFEDDEDSNRYDIALNEFKEQLLIEMNVEELNREWLLENWDSSYDCNVPGYQIEKVALQ